MTENADQGAAPANTDIGSGSPAGQGAGQGSWWSSIDFGESKDAATAALSSFKTPQDLVGALDWRKSIAGGDEKAMKRFERYSTLQDVGKAHLEAVSKISSGELAKPLPKDATPEQVAEWRRGNGIPEKPEGYFEKLPNGLVIGEDDKPLFDGFAKAMHGLNAPPAMIHEAVKWYYGMQDQQIQVQQVADSESKTKLESALRTAWGNDFGANANVYSSFLASAPKDVQQALTTARDVEGNFVLYRPEVVSWITGLAREINPAATIVPAGNAGGAQSIEAEVNSIKSLMGNPNSKYWKGPESSGLQERYRQLVEAQTKIKARSAA